MFVWNYQLSIWIKVLANTIYEKFKSEIFAGVKISIITLMRDGELGKCVMIKIVFKKKPLQLKVPEILYFS